MSLTVTIPEELADDIRPFEQSIPEILQKEVSARESCDDPVYVGFSDVLETLVRRPSPDVVLALRPSSALQARLDELLEKNRTTRLTPDEWRELNRYTYLNHLVRMAKAEAAIALKPQP